jgi:hypothetical protein
MEGVPRKIIGRQLAHFDQADPASGKGVGAALRLEGAGTSRRRAQPEGPATPVVESDHGLAAW